MLSSDRRLREKTSTPKPPWGTSLLTGWHRETGSSFAHRFLKVLSKNFLIRTSYQWLALPGSEQKNGTNSQEKIWQKHRVITCITCLHSNRRTISYIEQETGLTGLQERRPDLKRQFGREFSKENLVGNSVSFSLNLASAASTRNSISGKLISITETYCL